MACEYCDFKGYVTTISFINAKENTSISVCPKCNDVKAYSNYVKELYSISEENKKKFTVIRDNVIDFIEYKKNKV